jgi:hypothetical protein
VLCFRPRNQDRWSNNQAQSVKFLFSGNVLHWLVRCPPRNQAGVCLLLWKLQQNIRVCEDPRAIFLQHMTKKQVRIEVRIRGGRCKAGGRLQQRRANSDRAMGQVLCFETIQEE